MGVGGRRRRLPPPDSSMAADCLQQTQGKNETYLMFGWRTWKAQLMQNYPVSKAVTQKRDIFDVWVAYREEPRPGPTTTGARGLRLSS